MSDGANFDPITRANNAARRLLNLVGQMNHHAPANASGFNALLKTIEHSISAAEQDVNHRDENAAAAEMLDAQGTALIAEQEYGR
jgi:hypothetical protein